MRIAKWIYAAGVVAGALGGVAALEAQKGGGCRDIATRWYIYPVATLPDQSTIPAAISGDGGWYTGGSIHRCGTSPTNDATIKLSKSRRVTFAFPVPVSGSIIEEALTTSGATYQDGSFLNLRNILCVGCANPSAPFTTHFALQLYDINRQQYRLRFMPPGVDAPDLHIDPAIIPSENTPYEASPALVVPQPYDCASGGATRPSWIVRGVNPSADPSLSALDNLQVGTLRRVVTGGTVHAGQYSMPFEMRIEALSCFTY